jgi:hypothetical protein
MSSQPTQPNRGLLANVRKFFDIEARGQPGEVEENDDGTLTLPSDDEEDRAPESDGEATTDGDAPQGEEEEAGIEESEGDDSTNDEEDDELEAEEETTDYEEKEKDKGKEYILIEDSDYETTDDEEEDSGSSIGDLTDPDYWIRSGGMLTNGYPSHDVVELERENETDNLVAKTSDPEEERDSDDSGNETDPLPDTDNLFKSNTAIFTPTKARKGEKPVWERESTSREKKPKQKPYRLVSSDDDETVADDNREKKRKRIPSTSPDGTDDSDTEIPPTLDDDGKAFETLAKRQKTWDDERRRSEHIEKRSEGDRCRNCGSQLMSRKERDAGGYAPTFRLGDWACHKCDV